jgi:hypothetical protein
MWWWWALCEAIEQNAVIISFFAGQRGGAFPAMPLILPASLPDAPSSPPPHSRRSWITVAVRAVIIQHIGSSTCSATVYAAGSIPCFDRLHLKLL